jgi:hypothetical protein
MFWSYDHHQAENILIARVTQLTTDPLFTKCHRGGHSWTKFGRLVGYIAAGLRQYSHFWLQASQDAIIQFFSLLDMYVFRNRTSSSMKEPHGGLNGKYCLQQFLYFLCAYLLPRKPVSTCYLLARAYGFCLIKIAS